ncbi:hypothetical protein ISY44_001737, partial [Campylobacter jejuni]|nr:hypothetical protein [Campylobacter jejuni]
KVIGAIIDKNLTSNIDSKSHLDFLHKNNIKEIQLEDLPLIKYDLCLIITYSKILDMKYFKNGININIHGGILPYWRGFYANIWAVLNNQSYIGYTLHALNKKMDDGAIYYIIKERIHKNEKFFNANKRLREKICNNIPELLINIHNKKIKPKKQPNKSDYFFCSKIKSSDLIIANWNQKSEYFYNLFRIFSKPGGTGLFVKYNNNLHEITELKYTNTTKYLGIPGTVVNKDSKYTYIKTQDSYIKIILSNCNLQIGVRL